MTEIEQLQQQLTELEIRLAWQDDLLQDLNETVARLSQNLELQQAQLRLLYHSQQKASGTDGLDTRSRQSLLAEIPPHY